jgi:hypothetical protein
MCPCRLSIAVVGNRRQLSVPIPSNTPAMIALKPAVVRQVLAVTDARHLGRASSMRRRDRGQDAAIGGGGGKARVDRPRGWQYDGWESLVPCAYTAANGAEEALSLWMVPMRWRDS